MAVQCRTRRSLVVQTSLRCSVTFGEIAGEFRNIYLEMERSSQTGFKNEKWFNFLSWFKNRNFFSLMGRWDANCDEVFPKNAKKIINTLVLKTKPVLDILVQMMGSN